MKELGETHSPAPSGTPYEYQRIKQMFEEAKDNDTEILLENTELSSTYSVVLKLTYVGNYFCVGQVRYHRIDKTEYVPYSIHYSDIHSSKYKNSVSKNTKVTFKGANPYGTNRNDSNG